MRNIRAASDLENQYLELDELDGLPEPPLTDDPSSPFCRDIDAALAWSLKEAEKTDVWYTGEEVFGRLRKRLQGMIDEQRKMV